MVVNVVRRIRRGRRVFMVEYNEFLFKNINDFYVISGKIIHYEQKETRQSKEKHS
jgi:hypothetical protein